MQYRCLAEFLEVLGRYNAFSRVSVPVDPLFEIAEISRRSMQKGGNALLFGTVQGHDWAVLTNLLATESRICQALGVSALSEAADRITQLLAPSGPEGWLNRLKGGGHPVLAGMMPKQVKTAACQQIVRLASDIRLGQMPWLQALPWEAGRSIHAATIFTAEPDSHRMVVGQFNVQLLGNSVGNAADDARLAIPWFAQDEHAILLNDYRVRGRKMPLAVVLGGDPAFLLASAASLPPGGDVCAIAGVLREKPIDVVACRSIDLEVPAEAEIVLEGYCDPTESPVMAGPLCSPLGGCGPTRLAPVMHVTAVTHRANPIFAVMTPCPPPNEAGVVHRAMDRVFLPLTRLAMPELVDYDLPEFGAARHWAAVAIRKRFPGQARSAAHAARNLRPMRFAKVLVVVDEDVDVHDTDAVLAAVTANMNPGCDVILEEGPSDPLDPAVSALGIEGRGLGCRMTLDATRKLAGERGGLKQEGSSNDVMATMDGMATMCEEIRQRVEQRGPEYGLGASL
jgi:4-hydroxy-3-polyprenylbenzoate decarboxylase